MTRSKIFYSCQILNLKETQSEQHATRASGTLFNEDTQLHGMHGIITLRMPSIQMRNRNSWKNHTIATVSPFSTLGLNPSSESLKSRFHDTSTPARPSSYQSNSQRKGSLSINPALASCFPQIAMEKFFTAYELHHAFAYRSSNCERLHQEI